MEMDAVYPNDPGVRATSKLVFCPAVTVCCGGVALTEKSVTFAGGCETELFPVIAAPFALTTAPETGVITGFTTGTVGVKSTSTVPTPTPVVVVGSE